MGWAVKPPTPATGLAGSYNRTIDFGGLYTVNVFNDNILQKKKWSINYINAYNLVQTLKDNINNK